ncbi:YgiT-type zinc finger domain-containing protein [Natronincola peptidivorans]|uniref:YgiT-type zinc finger domain-containing protein n=1 Tax=Natronincola peptidivorans TaxID=426128 RepID=A0A1I0E0J0_9FIRM|nr:YgiT-type zinc finger protein [Natronincola peptidivorans]SET38476.1 YgiT-type zinc finger domain-containing protein [Natronincola peptidivorans]
MFNVCYDCNGELVESRGNVYGYWGDVELIFPELPKYQCNQCDEFYLDEKTAILIQEITRALDNIKETPEIVDIRDSYDLLIKHVEEVYEIITEKKLHLIKTNNKIIINRKDIYSIFNKDNISVAARKHCNITKDVEKEIDNLFKGKE